jgi:hypothetical protein
MGKGDKKAAASSGPVIAPDVLERLMNPPKRGVDGNLSAMVSKKIINGSQVPKNPNPSQ